MAPPVADVLSSKVPPARGVQGARGSLERSHDIEPVVRRSRLRLTHHALSLAIVTHTSVLVGVAAACAAVRPLVWARHDAAHWVMPARAVTLAVIGAACAAGVLLARAFRRRPGMLASARALDAALGLEEVVASGFAFESANRDEPIVVMARERAARAVASLDVEGLLVRPRSSPLATRTRLLLGAALVTGLALGSLDAAALDRLRHPLTARELTAADALALEARAARADEAPRPDADDPKRALEEAAKRAAEAAKRGDRASALAALDELRAAARAMDAEARERKGELDGLREELEASATGAARGGDPSEALRKMREAAGAPGGGASEALRAMAERLARAERAAAGQASRLALRSGERPGAPGAARDAARASAWSRAAEALREARDAAARGDAEAAKRALERAESAIADLERAARSAGSRERGGRDGEGGARLSREASALDRALRAGMRGQPESRGDGEGEGEGEGDEGQGSADKSAKAGGKSGAKKQSGRGGAKEGADGEGAPTEGPGRGDRTPGAAARRIAVPGSLEARGDVRSGERAVSAIQGLGRGDEGRAFRDVFPSYESAVEDGLKDERVPAARRAAVRRYFSAIRPGDAPEEKKP